MKFGNYLRECREAKGWSQPEAADRIGIEQSYLSKLETGRSYPSGDMFGRIAEAYGIDVKDLASRMPPEEIERLREIGEVRTAVLTAQRRSVSENRRWLVGGVSALVLAGACAGVAVTAQTQVTERFLYRSQGVLGETEQLDTFDRIHDHLPDDDHPEVLRRRETVAALLQRLDPVDRLTTQSRGSAFVEPVPEGRRYFQLVTRSEDYVPSPLRWFVIPALMFLGGAIGCFVAAFRWR